MTHDQRLAAALAVRKLDGLTEAIVAVVEDVDGIPMYVEEAFQQTVVFRPEAFGLTAAVVEAAARLEPPEPKEQHD